MRQTPVDDYLEEISTELPEELYGNLSDAIYETVCEFDEEVAQLKAENAKLRELVRDYERCSVHADCGLCEYDGKLSTHCPLSPCFPDAHELRELGIEVDE